jgi:hypothetical protein
MIHIATFNIFWFPSKTMVRINRSLEDERLIQRVLERLGADVIVFQEILEVQRLAALLARVPGRTYQVRQASPPVTPGSGTNAMHIVLPCDRTSVEPMAFHELRDPAAERDFKDRRLPVVAHLRHNPSGWEYTVVGVHLKSGAPDPAPDADD